MSVLVADDGDGSGAPSPDTLLGLTHCTRAEHSGAEGVLTLLCKQCDVLLCRACIGSHVNAGHGMCTVEVAAADSLTGINAALPELRQGLAHQVAHGTLAHSILETLALNRACALEALAAATARLHAEVDAKQVALAAEIEAAYVAKVSAVQREVSAARAGAAELSTMVAAAEAALGDAASSVLRVHVGRSVGVSLGLARHRRDALAADVSALGFVGVDAEQVHGALVLGSIVTSVEAPAKAVVSAMRGVVLWCSVAGAVCRGCDRERCCVLYVTDWPPWVA